VRNRPHEAKGVIASLSFAGPELGVVAATGKIPAESTPTGSYLRQLKWALAEEGVFRHEDMFAFAERALGRRPRMQALLAKRFPLVMVDEMQDTSGDQEALLRNAFGVSAVMQRFGDINQRIFETRGKGAVSFPREPYLSMRKSRRFGTTLAGIVSCVRVEGEAVIGAGPACVPPTLLVYETAAVTRVISAFGRVVLESFDDETLANGGAVQAVCARRTGEAQQAPGRHVGDFWPPLSAEASAQGPRAENAWHLLATEAATGSAAGGLSDQVERVRRVVLLALRQANAPVAEGIREPWRLFRSLDEAGVDMARLRMACRAVVFATVGGMQAAAWGDLPATLHAALAEVVPASVTADAFAALPVFARPAQEGLLAGAAQSAGCVVTVDGRAVTVGVDTVAMTKGETHLATLYLESFGKSARFDLTLALELITGRTSISAKTKDTVKAQLRNAYVGLSRPTRLLCLAINSDRLQSEDAALLIAAGWNVRSVV
jgi:hypothetical protein